MSVLDRPASPATTTRRATFGDVLRAEWIKLWSVRSTGWTIVAGLLVGGAMTVLVCALNADWVADESVLDLSASFLTWDSTISAVAAVALGALVVTGEHATGMVRTTFAAVPARGRVLAAKGVVLTGVLVVLGTVAASVGYAGGRVFLDAAGAPVPPVGDMVRPLLGSGLFMAGVGLFTLSTGFLLRSTAGTIATALAVLLLAGGMVQMLPGPVGEWLTKLAPGNAGASVAEAGTPDPTYLGPWTGLGVFALQVGLLLVAAWVAVRRRDA